MIKTKLLLFLVFFFSMSVWGVTENGRWSKPFHPGVGTSLLDARSTGDYIWFITTNGIGRYNTVSGATIFFSASDLPVNGYWDWEETDLAVGDSCHVAFFYDDNPGAIYLYDGLSWKHIIFPNRTSGAAIDKNGNQWTSFSDLHKVIVDRSGNCWINFSEVNGTNVECVLCYDGKQWNIYFPLIPGLSSLNPFFIDNSGVLWFSFAAEGSFNLNLGCYNRISDSISIFKDSLHFDKLITNPQGKIWLTGDSLVYSVSNDGSIVSIKIGKEKVMFSQCIDTDGNLWRATDSSVSKFDLHSSEAKLSWIGDFDFNKGPVGSSILSCNNGVYVSCSEGFIYHKNNEANSIKIPLDSIWGDVCGDFDRILFTKKDGQILFTLKENYLRRDNCVYSYKNGTLNRFPIGAGDYLSSICELSDGSLAAGFSSSGYGLFKLNNSEWKLLQGTENIPFSNLFVDKKGMIWSILDKKIIHQTETGWELIDSTNSNLPAFGQIGLHGNRAFLEDADGAIWALLDSNVVKTNDGYTWEIFNEQTSGFYRNSDINMHVNRSGRIQLLYSIESNDNGKIVRATYNDMAWKFDTIRTSFLFLSSAALKCDSYDNIYISTPVLNNKKLLYCYNNTSASWIQLDTPYVPYEISTFLGDDKHGKLYFNDFNGRTIVYDSCVLSVLSQKISLPAKSIMSVRCINNSTVWVNYSLAKSGKVSLSLFSADGRLVRHLINGFHKPGNYQNTFNTNISPGFYLIRLRTADNLMVKRVLVR